SFLQMTVASDGFGVCGAFASSAPALPRGSADNAWSAEGSQAFVTSDQQHYVAITSTGSLRHWFLDSTTGLHADTWAIGMTGIPTSFAYEGAQQHVFARTRRE